MKGSAEKYINPARMQAKPFSQIMCPAQQPRRAAFLDGKAASGVVSAATPS
jgi:hypothetical protein